jgi:hypothetical protein
VKQKWCGVVVEEGASNTNNQGRDSHTCSFFFDDDCHSKKLHHKKKANTLKGVTVEAAGQKCQKKKDQVFQKLHSQSSITQ